LTQFEALLFELKTKRFVHFFLKKSTGICRLYLGIDCIGQIALFIQ
jgi:hypothetical protein